MQIIARAPEGTPAVTVKQGKPKVLKRHRFKVLARRLKKKKGAAKKRGAAFGKGTRKRQVKGAGRSKGKGKGKKGNGKGKSSAKCPGLAIGGKPKGKAKAKATPKAKGKAKAKCLAIRGAGSQSKGTSDSAAASTPAPTGAEASSAAAAEMAKSCGVAACGLDWNTGEIRSAETREAVGWPWGANGLDIDCLKHYKILDLPADAGTDYCLPLDALPVVIGKGTTVYTVVGTRRQRASRGPGSKIGVPGTRLGALGSRVRGLSPLILGL